MSPQFSQLRYTGILIITVLMLFSCSRKLERPAINPQQLVTITGIDSIYYINIGDTLRIRPRITSREGNLQASSRYEIKWTRINPGNSTTTFNTPNLSVPIDISAANIITWYLRVTDKQLGIFTQQKFLVSGLIPTQEGWFVLCDIGNNQSRLDMLSYHPIEGFTPIPDILTVTGSEYDIQGSPRSVDFAYTLLAPHQVTVAVVTDKEAMYLKSDDLTPQRKIELGFPAAGNFNPATYSSVYSFNSGLHNVGGQLYYSNTNSFYNAIGPVQRSVTDNSLLNVSPFMAASQDFMNSFVSDMVFFDTDQQTFYSFVDLYFSATTRPVPMGKGTLFDFNINKQLLYLQFTPYNGGEYYAVLKDNAANVHYLAIFNIKGQQRYFSKVEGTGIAATTQFAISAEFGYLFYVVGNKVYEFDPTNQANTMVKDFGEKKISYMSAPGFPISIAGDNRKTELSRLLLVATYEASNISQSGVVDLYRIPAANEPLELKNSYSGFGKVVSMAYAEKVE